tara:strand:+ start:343 stop:561 length:219 start_codon:yes stop_codon:yes gene_type:complete
MDSEKLEARTKRRKKFKDMTFDERVVIKEMSSGQIDPDVARANTFLSKEYTKKRIDRKKALIAIMQMRGLRL